MSETTEQRNSDEAAVTPEASETPVTAETAEVSSVTATRGPFGLAGGVIKTDRKSVV